ncbi:MAG: glycine-rich protein [Clostridia bacterium]|nr:glycine-rich protein [Clostridia bacterium]
MKGHSVKKEYNKNGGRLRVLMIVAAVFTAIAVAVTCALCIDKKTNPITGDNISSSASGSATYTNVVGDKTAQGALNAGDILDYSFENGKIYDIKLPKGTFKLEVWGAQGGAYDTGCAGGLGGYTYVSSYEVTPTTGEYLYIVVGGQGTGGTGANKTGGYNGGGTVYIGNGGGAGGGATHIATVSGTLNNLSSTTNQAKVLLVAGGGGGSTTNNHSGTYGQGGYGGGANNAGGASSGGWIDGGGYQASGGQSNTGGAGGKGATTSSCSYVIGQSGSFGKGGDSYGATNSTAGYEAGGGGGGGWYGGGGGGGDSNSAGADGRTGGGGGSGHIKSGLSGGGNNGTQSGNGKARITVISVNQAPTSRSATITGRARGTSGTTQISVDTIAQDPDATKTTLAFTNGNSSDYEAFSRTENGQLYYDASCASGTEASSYLSWNWGTDNRTLNITEFKRYPRAGINNSPANGQLQLYVKVRDSFGTATQHACSVIGFKLTFAVNTVSTATKTVSTSINGGTNDYVVGKSTTNVVPTGTYTPTTSNIFNPNHSGSGVYTAVMPEPVRINRSFVVKASDLLNGVCSYDQAVIALNDTSAYASSVAGRRYKIDELDANSKVTAFNSAKSQIANAFSQITVTCLSPTPAYQVIKATLYVVEKTTAYGASYPNTVPDMASYPIDIVFCMQNSRPYIGSTSNIVNVAVGETRALALGGYFADADEAISSSTHTITEVVVPKHEFIQLNANNELVAQTGVNAGFYNIGSADDDTFKGDGQGSTPTGFAENIAYNSSAPVSGTNTREAFLRFTYANDTLTVYGLRSSFSQYTSTRATKPGHFYLLMHIQDKRDVDDGGIWLPLAFVVGYASNGAESSYAPVASVTAPGGFSEQTATDTFPTASGNGYDPTVSGGGGDSFYFAPMAVGYGGMHVIGKYKDSSGNLVSDGLQPLALDGDNFATTDGLAARNGKLNELLRLTDTTAESVVRSVSDVGFSGDANSAENKFIKAEIIPIYIDVDYLATGTYIGATGGRIVAAAGTNAADGFRFAGVLPMETVNGDNYYKIDGLKITLKAATMNRYFYAKAKVTDISGVVKPEVTIAIRVNNKAPVGEKTADNVVTFGQEGMTDAYTQYDGSSVPTFTLKIPLGNSVAITPYDFANDFNMTNIGLTKPANGFSINGLQGVYDPATGILSNTAAKTDDNIAFDGLLSEQYNTPEYRAALASTLDTANGTTTVKRVSSTASGTAANSAISTEAVEVPNDRLYFARTSDGASDAFTYNPTQFSDIIVTASDTEGYINYNVGNKLQIDNRTHNCDFIIINAVSRTTRDASINLVVRDRYGDSADGTATFAVRIIIDVVNTAPVVKNEYRYQELAVTPVTDGSKVMLSTATFGSNGNGAATGLMKDVDGDMPEFILAADVIITNTCDLAGILGRHPQNFDVLRTGHEEIYTDDGTADGRPLTEYITASLGSPYELSVTALSSTKAIGSGVYVCFIVTDNNGGSTFGYVRIEVVDTKPVFNTAGENGFDKKDPLWAIKTTSNADISRDRYIVGSRYAFDEIKSINGAVDADVRLIATDEDGLHDKLLLSPRIELSNGTKDYINLVLPIDKTQVIPDDAFERAVPKCGVDTSFSTNAGAAILLFMRTPVEDGFADSAVVPDDFEYEILFLKNGKWWKRADFIAEFLHGKTISEISEFFDAEGRFVFADWAFRMHATQSIPNNGRVGISIAVRDAAELGGDTAGIPTAFDSERRNPTIKVDSEIVCTVYYAISTTGIRTKDEFAHNYDNYYAVEYTKRTPTSREIISYVPTYDGDKTSVYGADATNITYFVDANTKFLAEGEEGTHVLKTRAQNLADETKAGINAGAVYDPETIDTVTGAYKYPTTIIIPADGSDIYVPMSYFGLLQNLVAAPSSNGDFEYLDEYVGYNIGSTSVYSRANVADFATALTVSDGDTIWTGEKLNENPYVNIAAFDDYSANGSTSSAARFDNTASTPYYNNRLAITTVDEKGQLLHYVESEENRKSFIGNGSLMYLEEQAVKLQEHNFGLVISKTNMRTGVNNITLTLRLAKSKNGKNTISDINPDADSQTVTVNIRVENSAIDIAADNGTGTKTGVKYDADKGTYYVDVSMSSADSKAFSLLRRDMSTGNVEPHEDGVSYDYAIPYTDPDYRKGGAYRDYAYFLPDSFGVLSSWDSGSAAYNRILKNANGKFVNAAASQSAQKSLLNYWGISSVADVDDIDDTYSPNSGIYGSNIDGYSSYFNASLSDSNKLLNITASRKTTINEVAIDAILATGGKALNQENVKAIYAERGIVAEYSDASVDPYVPTRTYYPFRVLIFDSCGAGWSDAAFVSLELRITITNADPKLKPVGNEKVDETTGKPVGREYRFNLAVGNSVTINLYDIVSDTDMVVRRTVNNYSLVTKDYFIDNSKGIELETGDYLDSPYAHDKYLSGETSYDPDNAVKKSDGTYYRNGGGLSLMHRTGDPEPTKDVTMWMETPEGSSLDENVVPLTNSLSFTVHRRTAASVKEDGKTKSVAIDEYRFTLRFYDSFSRYTDEFTFIITVTNQAPAITSSERHFTMHSGDDLTLLTMYYDEFIGGVAGGSAAYRNSLTKQLYEERKRLPGYGSTYGDGQNNGTDKFWLYENITSDLRDDIVYDSTVNREDNDPVHLGYVGLASDDMPWKLRVTQIDCYNGEGAKLWIDRAALQLQNEGVDTETYPLAFTVRAISACVNEPVTVTLSDGDGGSVTVTIYFTVISSPPVALDYGDESDRILLEGAGIKGERNDGDGYLAGVFGIFTTPGPDAEYTVESIDATRMARKQYRIGMSSVAKDPDSMEETNNMTLYGGGEFSVNGVPLVSDGKGVFGSDYFDITVVDSGRAFILTATGYNPDTTRGYEILTFRVADYGNNSYGNSIEITLRVYTLYSDMHNDSAAKKTTEQFNAYLAGGDKVNVKSYNDYYGADVSVATRYAFIDLDGNEGNDGNAVSPIVDPDVKEVGKINYTARLYAFINVGKDGATALDAATLSELFVRDATKGTFRLRDRDACNEYFIGGIAYNGAELPVSGGALNRFNAVKRYVNFEFGEGGTSLIFTPNASTLDNKGILLYVEAEKHIGSSRAYKRADASLAAGSLFALNVEDSAPEAVVDYNMPVGVNRIASGNKGDTVSFKIYDAADPFGALFTDADYGDEVTVKNFTDADYETALSLALEENPKLDWAASEGKPRAFDISVDTATSTLNIKINRRMDELVGDVYAKSVSFPIVFEGVDKVGKSARTVIVLTVGNKDVVLKGVVPGKFDPETNVGYSTDLDAEGNYVINAQIRYSCSLEIDITDFVNDPDYVTGTDSDSFKFVGSNRDVYPYKYLTDETQDVYWYETDNNGKPMPDTGIKLATVEPLGEDKWHRTGIRLNATGTMRTLTARTYIRVLDRAGDSTDDRAGAYLILNISVMNDAPHVLPDKEITDITLIGAESGTPDSMLFFIGDFVGDNNNSDVTGDMASAASETYLRIFSQQPGPVGSIYSITNTSAGEKDNNEVPRSSALFTVTVPETLPEELVRKRAEDRAAAGLEPDKNDTTNYFNQWFVITPNAGYYGDGYVEVLVADGDSNVHYDSLSTSFRINVNVVYDQSKNTDAFNPLSIPCCKSKTVDIGRLMPEFDNKLVFGSEAEAQSDDGNKFSQSEFYTLTSVTLQNSSDEKYVNVEQVGTSGVWTLTATKLVTLEAVRLNVKYTLNSDPTMVYSGYFLVTVVPNAVPKIKYKEITFTRYNPDSDLLRGLDETNTVRIEAWQILSDDDDPDGRALVFVDVKSSVPSLVSASLSEDKRFLIINFAAKGKSEITLYATDETGVAVELKFTAINEDLPEGSLWLRITSQFESNTLMWSLILAGILILIIVLIVIIATVRRKKREREELEALLVSEMEIEEQMLKLAGGAPSKGYESFGYLPPTPPPTVDPGMMLGAGTENPTPSDVPELAPPPTDEPPADDPM